MSKYRAYFKGGPAHGEVMPAPSPEKIRYVHKIYDLSGFSTTSKYKLVKEEGDELWYELEEERFDHTDPTPFERNPK
jgi:hypothetical protein